MNSPNLGALASDQKIQNIFRAFGYSIPVGKDGRRLGFKVVEGGTISSSKI